MFAVSRKILVARVCNSDVKVGDHGIGNAQIESATTKFILGANELSTQCQGGTTVRGALRETFFECTGCIPAFRDAAPVGVADKRDGIAISTHNRIRRVGGKNRGLAFVGSVKLG